MSSAELPPPLVILSPGRSFSTVIGAMLGCHPALCVLPETCLLSRGTMERYIADLSSGATYDGGFIQSIQELMLPQGGAESEIERHDASVAWALARRTRTTYAVLDEFRAAVAPKTLVEKTPSITANVARMREIDDVFERRARYVHLTRHPYSYSLSLIKALNDATREHPENVDRFLHLEDSLCYGIVEESTGAIDAQHTWLMRHRFIEEFLAQVEPERKVRVRGEDFVTRPRDAITALLERLGLSTEAHVIDAVLHPENWQFSKRGVLGSGDTAFYAAPSLKLREEPRNTLEGPLPWRTDRGGFEPAVRELAASYGYR